MQAPRRREQALQKATPKTGKIMIQNGHCLGQVPTQFYPKTLSHSQTIPLHPGINREKQPGQNSREN